MYDTTVLATFDVVLILPFEMLVNGSQTARNAIMLENDAICIFKVVSYQLHNLVEIG